MVIKFNLQRIVKSKWLCRCLRPQGRQKNMLEGYEKMRKDFNVVKVLQKINLLTLIARKDYSKTEWKKMLLKEGKKYFNEVFSMSSESEDSNFMSKGSE